MLLIERKLCERDLKNKIVLADGLIEISIQSVKGKRVVVGIECPKDIEIRRKERFVEQA